jgi:hypothetical protein
MSLFLNGISPLSIVAYAFHLAPYQVGQDARFEGV